MLSTQKYKKVGWEPDGSGFSLFLDFKMLEDGTFIQLEGAMVEQCSVVS